MAMKNQILTFSFVHANTLQSYDLAFWVMPLYKEDQSLFLFCFIYFFSFNHGHRMLARLK